MTQEQYEKYQRYFAKLSDEEIAFIMFIVQHKIKGIPEGWGGEVEYFLNHINSISEPGVELLLEIHQDIIEDIVANFTELLIIGIHGCKITSERVDHIYEVIAHMDI